MKPNPFSTRYISPNDCEFVWSPNLLNPTEAGAEAAVEVLCQELLIRDRADQIVGPHGCGKSTLANYLARQLWDSFGEITSLTIRENCTDSHYRLLQRNISVQWNYDFPTNNDPFASSSQAKRLLIIDGIELLTPLNRRLLIRSTAIRNIKLLLTTHRRLAAVNVLADLSPNLGHFMAIVERLQGKCHVQLTAEQIEAAFRRYGGNYRLSLRHLYDVYLATVGNYQPNQPKIAS